MPRCFDQGCPTEGADLAAFLVFNVKRLPIWQPCLDHRKAARRWHERAQTQLDRLLKLQVKKGHFFSPRDGQSSAPETHSLLNSIPILLGERLPPKIRSSLIRDLSPEGPFLTSFGLASEAPTSPLLYPRWLLAWSDLGAIHLPDL